jgi:hypothetical protein
MGKLTRDPVSEMFDGAARHLLIRAYAKPGQWVTTRVTDPTPRQAGYASERGIDVHGPDNPSVRGGKGIDAKTRWMRAFIRALYYQHSNYGEPSVVSLRSAGRPWTFPRDSRYHSGGSVRVQVGQHRPALGVIPAGRIIRIMLVSAAAATAEINRRPESYRSDSGGPRQSDPSLRDWGEAS